MTSCGLVVGKQGCRQLFASYGAFFARLTSNGSGFLPVRVFDAWSEAQAGRLKQYRGNLRLSTHVDPKRLVPQKTCAQRAVSLRIGIESCLCLPTFSLFVSPGQPSQGARIALAMVWLHSSWSTFGSV